MDATERALRAALRHRHQAAAIAVTLPAFVVVTSAATSVTRSEDAEQAGITARLDDAKSANATSAEGASSPSPLNLQLPHDLELHREGWKSNDPRFICEQERKVRARKKALREQRERERAVASLQAAAASAAAATSFVLPASFTAEELAHLSARKLMDALGPTAFAEALQACSSPVTDAGSKPPPPPIQAPKPAPIHVSLDDFLLTSEVSTHEDPADILAPLPEDEKMADAVEGGEPTLTMDQMLLMPVNSTSSSDAGILDDSLTSAGLHLDLMEMPPDFQEENGANLMLADGSPSLPLEAAIAALELHEKTGPEVVPLVHAETQHSEPLPAAGELPALPTSEATGGGDPDALDDDDDWLKAFDEPLELTEDPDAPIPAPPAAQADPEGQQIDTITMMDGEHKNEPEKGGGEAAAAAAVADEEDDEEETEIVEEGQVFAAPTASNVGAATGQADPPPKKKCGRGRIDPEQKQQNRRKTREAHSLIRRNKILANQASKKLRECIERVQFANGDTPSGLSSSTKKKKKQQKRTKEKEVATLTPEAAPRARSTEPPSSRRTKKANALSTMSSVSSRRPNRPMPMPSLPLAVQQRFISEHTRSWFSRTGDVPLQQQQDPQQLPTSFHPDVLSFHVSPERATQVLPSTAPASDPHLEQLSRHFDKAVSLSSMRATVRHVQANDSATWLARAWSDSLLTIESVRGPSLLHHTTFDTRGQQITCSAWSSAATHLAAGTTRGDVLAFDVQYGRPFASNFVRVPKHGGSASRNSVPVIWDVQWCRRDAYLAAGYDDGMCALFRCDVSNTPLRLFSPSTASSEESSAACCVTRFHPSYCYLLTGLRNGRVTLWDCNANIAAFSLQLNASQAGAQLADVAFSSDGTQLVLASDNGHLELWDLASARPITTFPRAPQTHASGGAAAVSGESLSNMLETVGTVTPGSTNNQRYRIHWAHDDAVVAHVHPAGVVQCFDTRFPQQHDPVADHAIRPAIRTASVLTASRAAPPRRVLSSGFTTRNVLTMFYS
jgi:hypothetical protein